MDICDSGYWVTEKCIIFPVKLTTGLLSLAKADTIQRLNLKSGERANTLDPKRGRIKE